MHIIDVHAEMWTLPLHSPFVIARRTANCAENVIIQISINDGNVRGLGASAPVEYVTGETCDSVLAAVEAISERLIGKSVDRLQPLTSIVESDLETAPAARAGLEMALLDAWARHHQIPLWHHFGGSLATLESDLTIPITTPEAAAVLAKDAADAGYGSLKIKVGDPQGVDFDLQRIHAAARSAPNLQLRIDANQAFTPQGAIEFASELSAARLPIELIEQPVAAGDLDGLKQVKESVHVPVFADEAACSPHDVMRILQMDAADGINVKLMKSGILGAIKIIHLCRCAGKPLMIGCMLETLLGITAAAQIAAGTGAFRFVDLDSHHLLAPVVDLEGGVDTCGPRLSVDIRPNGHGWGVEVRCRE